MATPLRLASLGAGKSASRCGTERPEYVSVPQLKETADTEKVCYSYDFYGLNYGGNRVAMSAKCANKEAAMKFIDGFYDEKVSLEVLFGGINESTSALEIGEMVLIKFLPLPMPSWIPALEMDQLPSPTMVLCGSATI